jgi:hypothetical protein
MKMVFTTRPVLAEVGQIAGGEFLDGMAVVPDGKHAEVAAIAAHGNRGDVFAGERFEK